MRVSHVAIVLALATPAAALAGAAEDGLAAYKAGDYANAIRVERPLADQGSAAAQYVMGLANFEGHGVTKSDDEAVRWWRKSADQGYADSEFRLAIMIRQRDPAGAVALLRKAANQLQAPDGGNLLAEVVLGLVYQNGDGVAADDAAALSWYLKAAHDGSALAAFQAGLMYRDGRGAPQNEAESVKWLTRAAAADVAGAELELGKGYVFGEGAPQDVARGRSLLEQAASHGVVRAEYWLALSYMPRGDGDGDNIKAAAWAARGAAHGDPGSMLVTAMFYSKGQGVEKNPGLERAWLLLSLKQGDKQIESQRTMLDHEVAKVTAGLSPGELAASDAFVRDWRPEVVKQSATGLSF